MKGAVASVVFVVAIVFGNPVSGCDAPLIGLPLEGQEAVDFLLLAEVVGTPKKFDKVAITDPARLKLSDGKRTYRAIFKDENTLHKGVFEFGDGRRVPFVRDSYRHEIAAYELARLLGLNMVSACVERKIFRRKGSLCLWVEGSRTESDRRKMNLNPPSRVAWDRQIYEVRLFQQLISDQDYPNIRNQVVDDNFRLYKVDSSMAFYATDELIEVLHPPVYSRRFLEALKNLDEEVASSRLEPWLLKSQLKSLWKRRAKILERADALIAEHGDKILY